MKKTILLGLMAVCTMIGVASCSKSANDEQGSGDGKISYANVKINETDDAITLTYTMKTGGESVEVKMEWEFSGQQCSSATMTESFSSEKTAKDAYNALKEEYGSNVSISGKKVTVDMTGDYTGMTREIISAVASGMKQSLENGIGA